MIESRKRLSLAVLTAYGAPGLPLAVVLLPFYIYVPVHYAVDLGLGFAVVGLVLLGVRFWDVFTDPLIGLLSDRTGLRLGRRLPWVLGGAPLLLGGAIMLYMPVFSVTPVYLAVWSAMLTLGLTMMVLPYTAWGAELTSDYHERSRVAAFREVFVITGTLVAVVVPSLTSDRSEGLAWLAIALLVLLPITILFLGLAVPRPQSTSHTRLSWRSGWAIVVRNGPFKRLLLAYLINGIANGLPATLFLLFVEHVIRRPEWSGPLLLAYFGAGVLTLPVWLATSQRVDKHRTWVAAMVVASIVFLFVPLLGEGDVWWFLAIAVITGATLGADLTIPASMQADVVDHDTVRSGRQRTGLYFALWSLATKAALALAVGAAFPLLEWSGFSTEAESNTGLALFALAALYSLLPALLKLTAAAVVWRHPITDEVYQDIRSAIAVSRS